MTDLFAYISIKEKGITPIFSKNMQYFLKDLKVIANNTGQGELCFMTCKMLNGAR
jgi:hypothetical protein